MRSWFLRAGIPLLGVFSIFAIPAAYADTQPGLELLSARVAQLSAFQGGGNTFSGLVDWDPGYFFSNSFAIRLDAGGMILKDSAKNNFVALEYGLLGSFDVSGPFWVEAGGGAQTWMISNASFTKPVINGNVVYRLDQKVAGVLDRVYAGYSAVLISGAMGSEIRVGLGLSL